VKDSAGWHAITFPTEGSIGSHRRILEPVSKWVNAVAKSNLSRLSPEKSNHCLPPEQAPPTLSKDVRPAATPGDIPTKRKPFLVRFSRDHVYRSTAERMCVIVYPSGRYHWEKGMQETWTSPHTKVYEGTVAPGELEELEKVLASPELVSAISSNPQSDVLMGEGEILQASIVRERTQEVRFHRFFNVLPVGRKGGQPGSQAGLGYEVSSASVLDPLQKWIKQKLEKNKPKPLEGTRGNDCFPTPDPKQ
jgi:hypothetical protein